MRIIIDKGIPFLEGVFGSGFEVLYLSPEEITKDSVCEADALFVRTRTKINRELLDGSKVRFVATATIGFDHIDQDFCREAGIYWVSCPGCNAQAVCDYIGEAIQSIESKKDITIGIVGYGHVGKKVAKMAKEKGFQVLVSDPPLGIGMTLDEMVPLCDVLTFHTPLTYEGNHATYHLCNASTLRNCKENILIINAARGGVIDEQALIEHLQKTPSTRTVIDCWEGEPQLNKKLLEMVNLASFHIAGYSVAGKMRASEMCLEAFCEFFSLPILSINKKVVPLQGDSEPGWLERISNQLKKQPESFEQLRQAYKLR